MNSRFRTGVLGIAALGLNGLACAGDSTAPELTPLHVIAYSSVKPTNPDAANIFVMREDGSGEIHLTLAGGVHPDWSPDGTRIVFQTDRDLQFEIYVMDAHGSNQRNLTRFDAGEPASGLASDEHPDWSPDGTRIVFSSARTGEGDLYIIESDGTGLVQLTNSAEPEGNPDWSPDGSRIVFERIFSSGTELWVVNADGSAANRLTQPAGHDMWPAWSPDGDRIVFSRYLFQEGQADLFVMNADGSAVTRLTAASESEIQPTWSADGSQILFVRAQANGEKLCVMEADGSAVRILTPRPGDFTAPTWKR